MSFSFSVDGFEELFRKFNILKEVPSNKAAQRAVLSGADVIVEQAKRLVRVNTGTLRESITAQINPLGGAAMDMGSRGVVVSIGPGPRGWYGHFEEFGTVNEPAHPFMRPAYESRKREATRIIADEIKVQIRQAVGN